MKEYFSYTQKDSVKTCRNIQQEGNCTIRGERRQHDLWDF